MSITPLAGKIAWMEFRRVGLYFVEADLVIEVEAEIRCGVPQSSQRVTQRYRADMCISMESGIEVEYGNFRIHRYEEDGTESGWTNTSFQSFIGRTSKKKRKTSSSASLRRHCTTPHICDPLCLLSGWD